MGDEPVLAGLRSVSDETLYLRLITHRRRLPAAEPAEDYYLRAGMWEIVNKAIRAEIKRRNAPPPPWWPDPPPRRHAARTLRRRLAPIVIYLCLLVGVAVLAQGL